MIRHNPDLVKLGRQPTRHDMRTLQLRSYVQQLPVIPDMKNWGVAPAAWGMMRNDTLGDCTIAAAGHIILNATTLHGAPVVITDDQIIQAYSAVSGYDPASGLNDNGAVELDVLNYWRNTGVGGHKILAYVAVPITDARALREAIFLFGSIYAGVDLPVTAQDQGVWNSAGRDSADGQPGSWGGHAIPLVGYDTKAFACVTWGDQKWLTDDWWTNYGSEAYAVISEDWAPPAGAAPNSFNLDQLKADLAAI